MLSSYLSSYQLCDHDSHEECDPDQRDAPSADRQHQMDKLCQYVRRYFPGLEDAPAITETCMYTVSTIDMCKPLAVRVNEKLGLAAVL